MNIEISRKSRKRGEVSRPSIPEIRTAATLYGRILFGYRKWHEDISVLITLKADPTDGDYGSTAWQDRNYRPREFHISINTELITRREVFRTLAHEFIHVNQFATGQIQDMVRSNTTKWEGKSYHTSDWDHNEHLMAPWEIDARGREEILFYNMADAAGWLDRDWVFDGVHK